MLEKLLSLSGFMAQNTDSFDGTSCRCSNL